MGRQVWQRVPSISVVLCVLGVIFNPPSRSATLDASQVNAGLLPWNSSVVSAVWPSFSPSSTVQLSNSSSAILPPTGDETRFMDLPLLPDIFLPHYPSFNSQLLDQQIVLYSLHLFLAGPPDILIVGSSRAIQGVDPDVLQRSLMEQGYPEYKIYNFSINGATAQVIDLVLTRILTPEQLPQLVIWADGSRALNSGRIDQTYDQILDSDGFRQISNGMHPIPYQPAIPQSAQCQDSPRPHSNIALQPVTNRTFSSAIALNFSAVADLWAPPTSPPVFHQLANLPSNLSLRSSPCLLPETDQVVGQSSSGRRLNPSDLGIEEFSSALSFDLTATGFLENRTEFDPNTYYKTYPYVAGAYDANYVPFSLDGVQTEAMVNISNYLSQQSIDLTFVNLPLTQNYLDATRTQYELEFMSYMQRYALRTGFTFIDLNHPEFSQNQYFADPSHLNAIGARVVAKQIALQPLIRWPTKRISMPN